MDVDRDLFSLQFESKDIILWANRYPVNEDKKIESSIAIAVKERGYYTRSEFLDLCRWKTPRSKPLVESNPESYIIEVTKVALSTMEERLRIEVLTLLRGINWPTASVLLHFGHSAPYPILDFRALWSLGIDSASIHYNFDFWWSYVQFCRQLASDCGVSMRVLDRALWQFSETNQNR